MFRTLVAAGLVAGLATCASAGLLAVPDGYSKDKPWPVIISYQDNPSPELTRKTPYFLVHAGGQGVEVTSKTRQYLVELAGKYNIDPFRIYGTGFSRGGHELLLQTIQHPDWFAAIAPVCHDLREEPAVLDVRYVLHTPTLLLHGTGDSFRKTGERSFELMKQAGGNVQFQTYAGGHTPQLPFKEDLTLLTKFYDRHVLDPYPKRIVHLVTHKRYSRAFWADATLIEDSGSLRGVFEVRAAEGNRIEIQANEHIAAVDLYLNERIVDMTRPVRVVSGEKELYAGPALSPLKITFREAKPYYQTRNKPLWEDLMEARVKAGFPVLAPPAPGATRPASTPATGPAAGPTTHPSP